MNYTKFNIQGGDLFICKVVDNKQLECLASKFENHHRFSKITHQKRKIEWLLSRLLLEKAEVNDIDILYNEHGKPFINHPKYKYISISHSNEIIGIYLHSTKNIGLDIESTSRKFEHLADKYLNKTEQKQAKIIHNGLALMWCIKEAVYKIANISGLSFINDININVQNDLIYINIRQQLYRLFNINHLTVDDQIIVCIAEEYKN